MQEQLSHTNPEDIALDFARGSVRGVLHPAQDAAVGLILVGGVGGGLDGPAALYPEIAAELAEKQLLETLRLDYHNPRDLGECVGDLLAGAEFMLQRKDALIAVGHSMGGAVAIRAGLLCPEIRGVVCLAGQSAGTEGVERLFPRPIFLAHGAADKILRPDCSKDIYRRARGDKVLRIYPDGGHCFEECRADLKRDLSNWLRDLAYACKQDGC